jgi:hypothetical protein
MPHHWKFFRTGGLVQVSLLTPGDLQSLDELDPKLWVALGCPVKGLEVDEKTLALIDTDNDGRVREPDIIAAAKWATSQLKNPELILQPKDGLPLSAIKDDTDRGRELLQAAQLVLSNLGTPQVDTLTVGTFAFPKDYYAAGRINGDGVIAPEAATDADTKKLIEDIAATMGATKGKTGTVGVTPAQVEAFFTELSAYSEWATTGVAPELRVFGEQTDTAYAAVADVRLKIDDYFTRCRLLAFDIRSTEALNRPANDYLALAPKNLALRGSPVAGPAGLAAVVSGAAELANFPIVLAAPEAPLPLMSGINPAWVDAVANLKAHAVSVAFGPDKTSLSESEWISLSGRFAAYEKWLGTKPAGKVAALNWARAKDILDGQGRAGLDALLGRDAALAPGFNSLVDLERLVRYRRDLNTILHNFVNFADFYSADANAVFQAGQLYLDARSCELCVKVDDPAVHAVIASMSKLCIAYVDCRRPGMTMKIAACFTNGDSDYLYVGRNGMFIDRQGRDWDATIVKLIDNPISIRQAFLNPYKKFVRFIEEQMAKRAGDADAAVTTALTSTAATATAAPGAAAAAATPVVAAVIPAVPHKIDLGMLAAIGVAVGGLSAAMAGLFSALFGLGPWMPAGIVGLLLAISAPSMFIAWLKLRQRTLGPLLEASGWAINGRVKINIPLGKSLTQMAKLPPGSERHFTDPYRDKGAFWRAFFFWVIVGAIAGYLIYARVEHYFPFELKPGK